MWNNILHNKRKNECIEIKIQMKSNLNDKVVGFYIIKNVFNIDLSINKNIQTIINEIIVD